MILQTLARHHLIVELHVAALHHAKQFLCLFVTLLKFRLIPGSIFQYQFPAIVKMPLLLHPFRVHRSPPLHIRLSLLRKKILKIIRIRK